MANACSGSTVGGQHTTDNGGQIVDSFVNNFHIHQGGERTVCGNCGEEKTCLRCSKVGKEQCEICGIWMSSKPQNVVDHQLLHSRERPYKCEQCPASFTRQHDLRRHMRIHLNEHKRKVHNCVYPCPECEENFCTRNEFSAHHAAVHVKEAGLKNEPTKMEGKTANGEKKQKIEGTGHGCASDSDQDD